VFEKRNFLRFHNAVKSEKTCIYFGKLFKTMSYDHCRQSFFEKFRRQAPVKSGITKIIKKIPMKRVHFWTRIVIGRSQC
jgi:hypothetical protein